MSAEMDPKSMCKRTDVVCPFQTVGYCNARVVRQGEHQTKWYKRMLTMLEERRTHNNRHYRRLIERTKKELADNHIRCTDWLK